MGIICIEKRKKRIVLEKNQKVLDSNIYTVHEKIIYCIIELNSGEIATGSDDLTIKIWDIDSNTCKRSIKDEDKILCLLEFKKNKLLAGNNNNHINLWNINAPDSSEYICTFKDHSSSINCLVKINDELFASGSNDKSIRIWNFSNKTCIKALKGHKNNICSLALLLDGKLCSGSDDCFIKIWNLKNYSCYKTLKEHTKPVKCVYQLSNGYIISGAKDKLIIWLHVLDFGYRKLYELDGHKGIIYSICKISDSIFASSSSDKTIKIWDTKTIECIETLELGSTNENDIDNDIIPIIYHSSGKLISSSKDNKFIILKNNIENLYQSQIVVANEKINLTFQCVSGCCTQICTDNDKSLNEVINEYFIKTGHNKSCDINNFHFLFCGNKLDTNSKEKIKDFVKDNNEPVILVWDSKGVTKK